MVAGFWRRAGRNSEIVGTKHQLIQYLSSEMLLVALLLLELQFIIVCASNTQIHIPLYATTSNVSACAAVNNQLWNIFVRSFSTVVNRRINELAGTQLHGAELPLPRQTSQ